MGKGVSEVERKGQTDGGRGFRSVLFVLLYVILCHGFHQIFVWASRLAAHLQ